MFISLEDIVEKSKYEKKPVSELMIEQEVELNGVSRAAVEKLMKRNLSVMMQAVEEGLAGVSSKTGLTGGDAKKLQTYIESGQSITGKDFLTGVAAAIARIDLCNTYRWISRCVTWLCSCFKAKV